MFSFLKTAQRIFCSSNHVSVMSTYGRSRKFFTATSEFFFAQGRVIKSAERYCEFSPSTEAYPPSRVPESWSGKLFSERNFASIPKFFTAFTMLAIGRFCICSPQLRVSGCSLFLRSPITGIMNVVVMPELAEKSLKKNQLVDYKSRATVPL